MVAHVEQAGTPSVSHSETQQTNASRQGSGFAKAQSAMAEPTIDRVVSLIPGFVYVFNHVTYSNDYTNRSVAEHLGYSSKEIKQLGSKVLMHLVHPEDQRLLTAHMQKVALLADDTSAVVEYRVVTKKGEERWLRSVDTVFDRGPSGDVLRHIGCASDFTAEKDAQYALTTLNAELENKVARRTRDLAALNEELEARIGLRTHELEQTVDELEQLTFIATHDLKVPANNLSRLARMMGNTVDDMTPEQAEQVAWITTCAAQLNNKIQGLVLVAQIRLSETFPSRCLNLSAEVKSAIQEMQKTMGGSVLPVACDIPDDLEVEFSRLELGSILTSILDNAVKYAAAARPLEIKIAASLEDGQVTLTVCDNGTGVDGARESQKVFGLFQRAHKVPEGSGISLYCAQRMLHRRGGAITVSGTRGEGAAFKLFFPRKEAKNDQG